MSKRLEAGDMKLIKERLDKYFYEINTHIELIYEAKKALKNKLPIADYKDLTSLEKFALNTLIFRFSKLQDLIGTKVFRNYLDFVGFETSAKSFFDILKEIEKEKIIDIDSWDELRQLRNQIAHEYPEGEDEAIESINLFIEKSDILIETAKKLEQKYNEIKQKRD